MKAATLASQVSASHGVVRGAALGVRDAAAGLPGRTTSYDVNRAEATGVVQIIIATRSTGIVVPLLRPDQSTLNTSSGSSFVMLV